MVLLLAGGQASADIVFTLTNVPLSDGGFLNGTFTTTDAITGGLVDFDLTTSGGALAGFEYTPATAISSPTDLPSIIVVETAALDHLLEVTFQPPLNAAGGTIKIGDADSFEQSGTGPNIPHRSITSGEATTGTTSVPEPSTLLLLAIGVLGLLVYVQRRRPA
jgi:hypothetical protein